MRFHPLLLLARGMRQVAMLAFVAMAMAAQAQTPQAEGDPSSRVAHVTFRTGGVVYAPEGEDEWNELPQNQPLTTGDRLWTDRGARAELHMGSATLHLDGESHAGISVLDDDAMKMVLQRGTLNARVRELPQGDNFEIGTPNLAFRALQPGNYRVDVDEDSGRTRVAVLSGSAVLYGDGGRSVQLNAGQQAMYAGRNLAIVQAPPVGQDGFAQWAAQRIQLEEASVSARHAPRNVVGDHQLDQHGSWGTDPTHGAVWYPRSVPSDWAPYRQGSWTYVRPWGWTWVDEAPWGFAPFHYGRWTQIGTRWAWAPGRIAPRPVYSPALVTFVGGGPALATGPAVAWYPLAPGEVWWPAYRASPRYVGALNFNLNLVAYPRTYTNYYWSSRPIALTAVRVDDFRRGHAVHRNWQRVDATWVGRARIGFMPDRPSTSELVQLRRERSAPRLQAQAPARERQISGAQLREARDARRPVQARNERDDDRGRGNARDERRDDRQARQDRQEDRRDRQDDRKDDRQEERRDRKEAQGRPQPGQPRADREERREPREERQGREERQDRRETRGERQERPQPAAAPESRQQPRAERPQERQPERQEARQSQREERGGGRPAAQQERKPEAREEAGNRRQDRKCPESEQVNGRCPRER